MFNPVPSPESPMFSPQEMLENKLRAFLSSVFKLLQEYEGYEPAVLPLVRSVKLTLPQIKDEKMADVLISEAVSSVTSDIDEQTHLIEKLLTAIKVSDTIDAAAKK